ncbi:hypothetical protein Esti_000784 [Eimeria stiedai]
MERNVIWMKNEIHFSTKKNCNIVRGAKNFRFPLDHDGGVEEDEHSTFLLFEQRSVTLCSGTLETLRSKKGMCTQTAQKELQMSAKQRSFLKSTRLGLGRSVESQAEHVQAGGPPCGGPLMQQRAGFHWFLVTSFKLVQRGLLFFNATRQLVRKPKRKESERCKQVSDDKSTLSHSLQEAEVFPVASVSFILKLHHTSFIENDEEVRLRRNLWSNDHEVFHAEGSPRTNSAAVSPTGARDGVDLAQESGARASQVVGNMQEVIRYFCGLS